MKTSRFQFVFWLFLSTFCLLTYQNCGVFEAISEGEVIANEGLVPETDQLDANCSSSDSYDVCIFQKSTVSQNEGSVSSEGNDQQSLQSLQTYGVRLTGLDSSGLLQNSSLKVSTLTGSAYQVSSGKVSVDTTGVDTSVEQLMAYYWLNRTIEHLQSRSSDVAVAGQGIEVVVDDTISGWNAGEAKIHLKKVDGKAPMAYDGGAMVYFLAEANAHYASNGAVNELGSNTHHITCGSRENGCCRSANGCSRAIVSGASDYLVGVMFPEDPKLGETWLNRQSGAGFCGQTRDLAELGEVSAATAYSACESSGGGGEIHTLGSIYASIWWEVRLGSRNDKEVDRLYLRHLQSLTGSDTFLTALDKIKQADQELFNGKYSSAFEEEFRQRGL